MVNYTKHQHISSLSATSTTAGVKDGADNIHSGIIKALELAAAGTAVLDYGSSVFQQTAGSTRTQFGVSGAIKYMREGVVTSATPSAVELGADPDTSNDRYDMIVIQVSDGAFAVRQGTAASSPRVPDNLTAGDIPVALVKVTAGATGTKNVTDRPVQLYGFDKSSNSINFGYNSSGYTEAGNITGSASGITVTPTLGGVIIDKDRASTVVSAEDITSLKIDFDRVTQDSGTAAHNDIGIDLDVSSSSKGTSTAIGMDVDVVGAGTGAQTVTGLDVTVSGGNTNYAALFNGGNVGIGETAPDATLHIKYSSVSDATPALMIESTDASGSSSPDIKFLRTSASPAVNDYIGHISFDGMNDADEEIDYAHIYSRIYDETDGSEDGALIFAARSGGSVNHIMHIRDNRVGIGATDFAPLSQLHIQETAVSNYNPDDYVNFIIEDDDARMQLVSNNGGNNGTNIIMTNIDGSTHHNWSIGTATTAQDNILHIGYNTATDDAGSYTDSDFTITKTGLVGIGTRAPDSMLEISKDTDAELIALKLTNQSDAASTAGKVSIQFDLEDTGGNAVDSGKIQVLKEQSFTATGTTQDSAMIFSTSLNGTLTEAIRITSDGKLRVAGNVIQASDGGATITMDTSDNVTISGSITSGTTITATAGLNTNGYFNNGAFEDIYSGSGADAIAADKSVIISTDAGGATKQYTLPSASGLSGRTITFKNVGAGNTTIGPNGAEKIDHDATTHALISSASAIVLAPFQSITLMAFSDGLISQGPAAGTTGWLTLN